jgi:hypothetical protein
MFICDLFNKATSNSDYIASLFNIYISITLSILYRIIGCRSYDVEECKETRNKYKILV